MLEEESEVQPTLILIYLHHLSANNGCLLSINIPQVQPTFQEDLFYSLIAIRRFLGINILITSLSLEDLFDNQSFFTIRRCQMRKTCHQITKLFSLTFSSIQGHQKEDFLMITAFSACYGRLTFWTKSLEDAQVVLRYPKADQHCSCIIIEFSCSRNISLLVLILIGGQTGPEQKLQIRITSQVPILPR